MSQLIVAMCKNGGIGYRDRLPWVCKKELELLSKENFDKLQSIKFSLFS